VVKAVYGMYFSHVFFIKAAPFITKSLYHVLAPSVKVVPTKNSSGSNETKTTTYENKAIKLECCRCIDKSLVK